MRVVRFAAMVALIILAAILFGVGLYHESTLFCLSGIGSSVWALIVAPQSPRAGA